MFSKLCPIFFIIPAIVARINIDVSLTNGSERDVHISGSSVSTIGEKEMSAFGLNQESLKNAVTTYMGTGPDNVFLNSPTPYGDLFETMNWEPTKMTFEPKEAAILSVKNEQVLVNSKEFHNTKAMTTTLKIDMRQLIRDTVSSKWDKENELEVENIHYNFDMKMLESPFTFISNGCDDFAQTIPVTVGDFTKVTLGPKQNLVAELYANAELMMLRVDYEASLSGHVALNFENGYEGHRFWSLDINKLLTAGGLKKTVHSSEIIEIVHFTDAKVLVKDVDTDEVIYTAPVSTF